MTKTIENLAKRKATGGRTRAFRGRRGYERDGYPIETLLGQETVFNVRTRGGGSKNVLRIAEHANVLDPSSKAVSRSKILSVNANPTNRDYQRRKVITKGAIIQTEAGVARVSSRPGQDGVVNAVLVK